MIANTSVNAGRDEARAPRRLVEARLEEAS